MERIWNNKGTKWHAYKHQHCEDSWHCYSVSRWFHHPLWSWNKRASWFLHCWWRCPRLCQSNRRHCYILCHERHYCRCEDWQGEYKDSCGVREKRRVRGTVLTLQIRRQQSAICKNRNKASWSSTGQRSLSLWPFSTDTMEAANGIYHAACSLQLLLK